MGRANLTRLLGNIDDTTSPALAPHPSLEVNARPPDAPSERATPAVEEPRGSSRPPAESSAEVAPGAPYLRFVRKETRLRDDQQNALTLHARRLGRGRPAASPRITENSLIRIAVDLLLARIDEAAGTDEATILESLKR